MDPETKNSGLPSRHRFSWDINTVPWTDGRGNQAEYKKAVDLWVSFHNKLPDTNPNKIAAHRRGIMLKSNLYGRAKYLCAGITDDQISSSKGVEHIVHAIYRRDPISVLPAALEDLHDLFKTKQSMNETFKDFEVRIAAQVAKFNSNEIHCKVSDSMAAILLLVNSAVDSSLKSIAVLKSVSPWKSNFMSKLTPDNIMELFEYESIAPILHQWDKPANGLSSNTMSSNSAITVSENDGRKIHQLHPTL